MSLIWEAAAIGSALLPPPQAASTVASAVTNARCLNVFNLILISCCDRSVVGRRMCPCCGLPIDTRVGWTRDVVLRFRIGG